MRQFDLQLYNTFLSIMRRFVHAASPDVGVARFVRVACATDARRDVADATETSCAVVVVVDVVGVGRRIMQKHNTILCERAQRQAEAGVRIFTI